MELKGESPIEAITSLPSGSMLATGSVDGFTRIYDVISGGKLRHEMCNHQKTVTSLSLAHNNTRLISASLDQHIKIYDLNDYKVLHSIKYESPILCAGVSQSDQHLVAGMSDGVLSIRHRDHKEMPLLRDTMGPFEGKTFAAYASFMRAKAAVQAKGTGAPEFIVRKPKHYRDAKHDRYLRGFRYSEALDAALVQRNRPELAFGVLRDLIQRNALAHALVNRDEHSLRNILHFLLKNVTDIRFFSVLGNVLDTVLEIYQDIILVTPSLSLMVQRIRNKIAVEVRSQQNLQQLLGCIEFFVGTQPMQS
eukprot:TRINITY_DN6056_c0_g1_i1.p1 TRINITY_DN6056_c0_g1~~TRINITY_DN6056_c0_g1_i1.p1  ORF type:complete len:360 (-),score=55.09 TRINITY_DN6056_c0_g1_i1:1042-1962(-)